MKNEIEIRDAFKNSKTLTEVSKKLECSHSLANMKRYIKKYNIDITHFSMSRGRRHERVCPMCGLKFSSWDYEDKKTCSRACSNKYFKRKHKKETKQKISCSLKGYLKIHPHLKLMDFCKFCGKEFHKKNSKTQYCSSACAQKSPYTRKKLSDKVQERIRNRKHQGWTSRNILSFPEKYFKGVFEKNGFSNRFVTNYPIKKRNLGIDCDACYFLDFYFPEFNLDVEIDGKQHERSEIKAHDEFRDGKLKENGYKIHRIKWKSLKDTKYFRTEIEKVLNILNC